MIEIRCKACDKLLGKASVFVGAIKCSRCKMIFEYTIYSNLHDIKDTGNINKETTESIAP